MAHTASSAYFPCVVLILVTLCPQQVLCVYYNEGAPTLNWMSTDFGNYFTIAGKRIPIGTTSDRTGGDILDINRSFLRDGIIGSLLRDFEDVQKIQNTGNENDRKHSDESQRTNVFSAHKLTGSRYDVSFACLNDTKQVLLDIIGKQLYALEMFDADTKIPSGILQGHTIWFGSYDECKSVQSPVLRSGHQFTGQYCFTSTMKPIAALGYQPISLGTCVPSTCSDDDVKALVRSLVDDGSGPPKPIAAMCEKEVTYTTGAITALVVCGILGALVCAGTLTDIYLRYTDDSDHRRDATRQSNGRVIQTNERTGLLSSTSVSLDETQLIHPNSKVKRWPMMTSVMTSFSFVKNTEKLMSTATASSPLSSLNGMRVLSMWWVILGHNYEIPLSYLTIQNSVQAVKLGKRFTFQAVLNGTFSVDTFFFMSGALVTYLCLKDIAEKGRTRWGMFYFHRIWRLTPAYAFCLMVYATMMQHFLHGPYAIVYAAMTSADEAKLTSLNSCTSKWWTNLLYINNFYPSSGSLNHICMAWTWYLANDMQFFVLSPIFIILLLRNRKAGFVACVAVVIACVFIRLMTAVEYGIHIPSQSVTKHKDDIYATNPMYNRPYTRIAPYMVGMLLGYWLHTSNCKARLNKISVLIGWSLAVVFGVLPVYGLYHYYHNPNGDTTLAISAFYISCSRLSWSLAIAWVIYACATGYGGPVNKILSWAVWAPLGRLTYCAYLVHPVIITVYVYNMPSAFFYGDLVVIYMYMGNLVSSYIVAYIISMVIEAPMMGLEKVFFKR